MAQDPKDEMYDFDKGGPILTDEDEELLDRIWARVYGSEDGTDDETEEDGAEEEA